MWLFAVGTLKLNTEEWEILKEEELQLREVVSHHASLFLETCPSMRRYVPIAPNRRLQERTIRSTLSRRQLMDGLLPKRSAMGATSGQGRRSTSLGWMTYLLGIFALCTRFQIDMARLSRAIISRR